MNKQKNLLTITMQHHKGNVMMISIRLSVVGRHIKLTPTYTILNTGRGKILSSKLLSLTGNVVMINGTFPSPKVMEYRTKFHIERHDNELFFARISISYSW